MPNRAIGYYLTEPGGQNVVDAVDASAKGSTTPEGFRSTSLCSYRGRFELHPYHSICLEDVFASTRCSDGRDQQSLHCSTLTSVSSVKSRWEVEKHPWEAASKMTVADSSVLGELPISMHASRLWYLLENAPDVIAEDVFHDPVRCVEELRRLDLDGHFFATLYKKFWKFAYGNDDE